MSEIILLCYLQGLEEEFSVCIDKTETIKELRELIKARKKKFILDNDIDIDKFEIWKVSVPLYDDTGLVNIRKNPAEIKHGVKLDDQQNIGGLWKNSQNVYIQVFLGIPNSENDIKDIKDELKEIKTLIQALSEQNINICKHGPDPKPSSRTRSFHTLSDLCTMGIRVDDELHFDYNYQKILHITRLFKVRRITYDKVNKKWTPSVVSIDNKTLIEWSGDRLSELERKIIAIDGKSELITLYNQAVNSRDEKKIEKILDKFLLKRSIDIGQQIDEQIADEEIMKTQCANINSHEKFTIKRGDYKKKVKDMIKDY